MLLLKPNSLNYINLNYPSINNSIHNPSPHSSNTYNDYIHYYITNYILIISYFILYSSYILIILIFTIHPPFFHIHTFQYILLSFMKRSSNTYIIYSFHISILHYIIFLHLSITNIITSYLSHIKTHSIYYYYIF